jgi:uncharacterized protein HemX
MEAFDDTWRWSEHAEETWRSSRRKARIDTTTERQRKDDAKMTKVRALLGVLAVLVLVAFAAGCGLVSDQGQARQEAKKKVEAKGQQVRGRR